MLGCNVSSKRKTRKNPPKGHRPLKGARQNAKLLAGKKAAGKKSKEQKPLSLFKLRRAAFEHADIVERHPEFQKKLIEEIQKSPEFRKLVVSLTARKLFYK